MQDRMPADLWKQKEELNTQTKVLESKLGLANLAMSSLLTSHAFKQFEQHHKEEAKAAREEVKKFETFFKKTHEHCEASNETIKNLEKANKLTELQWTDQRIKEWSSDITAKLEVTQFLIKESEKIKSYAETGFRKQQPAPEKLEPNKTNTPSSGAATAKTNTTNTNKTNPKPKNSLLSHEVDEDFAKIEREQKEATNKKSKTAFDINEVPYLVDNKTLVQESTKLSDKENTAPKVNVNETATSAFNDNHEIHSQQPVPQQQQPVQVVVQPPANQPPAPHLTNQQLQLLGFICNNILDDVYLQRLKYLDSIKDKIEHTTEAVTEIGKNIELIYKMQRQLDELKNSTFVETELWKRQKTEIEAKMAVLTNMLQTLRDAYLLMDQQATRYSYSDECTIIDKAAFNNNDDPETSFQDEIKKQIQKYGVDPQNQPLTLSGQPNNNNTSPALRETTARVNYYGIPLANMGNYAAQDSKINKFICAHTVTVQTVENGSPVSKFHLNNLPGQRSPFVGNRERGLTTHGPYNNPDDRIMNWAMVQIKDFLVEADSTKPIYLRGNMNRDYVEALLLYVKYLNKVEGKNIDIRNLTSHAIKITDSKIYGFVDHLANNKNENSPLRQDPNDEYFKPYDAFDVKKAAILNPIRIDGKYPEISDARTIQELDHHINKPG